jgi:putative aldouronate transport system permease protein
MARKGLGDRVFDIFNYIFMGLIAIITIYPIYYIFINSINDPVDASRGGIYLLPRVLSLKSLQYVLNNNDIIGTFLVSASRTILGAFTHIVFCLIGAFCLSKKDLFGKGLFMKLIVFTMYFSGGVIPVYMLMKWLHLTNNYLVYILPNLLNAFDIILIKTFIEQLPSSLIEAAEIDGANDMQVLSKVVAPLCLPILATIVLYNGVWQWSSWFDNYLYTSSVKELTTLQYLMVKLLRESDAMRQMAMQGGGGRSVAMSPQSVKMTVAMIIIIPIFLTYPFLQKYFVKGIMLGAVKG